MNHVVPWHYLKVINMASTMTSGDINLFMSGASRHAQATADQHEHELSVAIIGAKIWKPLSDEKVIVSVLMEGVLSSSSSFFL